MVYTTCTGIQCVGKKKFLRGDRAREREGMKESEVEKEKKEGLMISLRSDCESGENNKE